MQMLALAQLQQYNQALRTEEEVLFVSSAAAFCIISRYWCDCLSEQDERFLQKGQSTSVPSLSPKQLLTEKKEENTVQYS